MAGDAQPEPGPALGQHGLAGPMVTCPPREPGTWGSIPLYQGRVIQVIGKMLCSGCHARFLTFYGHCEATPRSTLPGSWRFRVTAKALHILPCQVPDVLRSL